MRYVLAFITALLAVNLWTGAPLFAVWVGSRLQSDTGLTMGVVGIVLAVLAATVGILVYLLTRVEAAYRVVTGQATPRRTAPWMRSLRDERADIAAAKPLGGFEKALVGTVVVAVLAFEAWFFVFAGSSIGSG